MVVFITTATYIIKIYIAILLNHLLFAESAHNLQNPLALRNVTQFAESETTSNFCSLRIQRKNQYADKVYVYLSADFTNLLYMAFTYILDYVYRLVCGLL